MDRDLHLESWQREQARDALILYYEQFRGISLREMPPPSPDSRKTPGPTAPRRVEVRSRVPEPARRESSEVAEAFDLDALHLAVVTAMRVKNYAYRTEQTYWQWIRRYVQHHNLRDPSNLGASEIHAFLAHLALNENVAASTQNQALNAVVFLYREVLKHEIMVRGGKGDPPTPRLRRASQDRRVPMPKRLVPELRAQLDWRRSVFEEDRKKNMHEVGLPGALARKYKNAPYEWKWQYVFPADDYSTDPRSGKTRRHHLLPIRIQRAVRRAATSTRITSRGHPTYASALLCHPSAGGGPGYPYGAGIAGACGCENHHDLHSCAQPRASGRVESAGQSMIRSRAAGFRSSEIPAFAVPKLGTHPESFSDSENQSFDHGALESLSRDRVDPPLWTSRSSFRG